jgi:DNA-binding GntR family transcriptional regulator
MPREASISRSILSDQIKDRLLEAILNGTYPPGSRIVETRVARECGTSQAPVREALRDLEALGVVEITAFRGARVRHPTLRELLDALVVRSELESLAARLAAPRMAECEFDELGGYVDQMRRAARTGDVLAETVADATFHGRIMDLAGNTTLKRVWGQLEPLARTYITMTTVGADRHRIADLHPPVLAALRKGDPEAAADAVGRHFASAASMLGELWTEPGAG